MSISSLFRYFGKMLDRKNQTKPLNLSLETAELMIEGFGFKAATTNEAAHAMLGHIAMTTGEIQLGGGRDFFKEKGNGDLSVVGIVFKGHGKDINEYYIVQIDVTKDGAASMPKYALIDDFLSAELQSIDAFFESLPCATPTFNFSHGMQPTVG